MVAGKRKDKEDIKLYAYYRNSNIMTYHVVLDFYSETRDLLKIWDFHHDKECLSPIPSGLKVRKITAKDYDKIPKDFLTSPEIV